MNQASIEELHAQGALAFSFNMVNELLGMIDELTLPAGLSVKLRKRWYKLLQDTQQLTEESVEQMKQTATKKHLKN